MILKATNVLERAYLVNHFGYDLEPYMPAESVESDDLDDNDQNMTMDEFKRFSNFVYQEKYDTKSTEQTKFMSEKIRVICDYIKSVYRMFKKRID